MLQQRIINLMSDYYFTHKLEPTQELFNMWLSGLKNPLKSHFEKLGFEKSKGVLSFKRFQLELKDIGLEEYLKENLTDAEYQQYKSIDLNDAK